MKNECSIVCDLLPLYAEDMVSEDTAEFVKEQILMMVGFCGIDAIM